MDASGVGRLIIVTGTSGTGIEESLHRWCASRATSFVRLEDHLLEVARERLGPEVTLNQVFAQPEGILRNMWLDAGRRSILAVRTALFDGDVIFRLNACWYHGSSGGFIFGVHIPTLSELPRPHVVITLIDDIYDTLIRLERRGKIFEHKSQFETLTGNLMKLLAWREIEVRASQQVAMSFGSVRYVILSVKHPVDTFSSLLDSSAEDCIYLSHPISALRRDELSVTRESPFLQFIQGASARLRDGGRFTIFEPTTIDELRLLPETITGQSDEILLAERWPAPCDLNGEEVALLADPLSAEEQLRAEQPFKDHSEAPESIKVLTSEIRNQIRWRDRLMVEQSSRLLVVRPFADTQGKMSGGVLIEIGYHTDLKNYFDDVRTVRRDEYPTNIAVFARYAPIVYHPEIDERKRRIGGIIYVLESAAAEQIILNWPTGTAHSTFIVGLTRRLRQIELTSWLDLSDFEVTNVLESCFPTNVSEHPARIIGQQGMSTLWSGMAAARDTVYQELGGMIKSAIRGKWDKDLDHSMILLESCELITEEFSKGEDLASAMLRHIERQSSNSHSS